MIRSIYWRCFPPFTDAYKTHKEDVFFESVPKVISDFKDAMKDIAMEWGVKSVGDQYLKNSNPVNIDGKLVLAIGYVSNNGVEGTGDIKKYALIAKVGGEKSWWDDFQIIDYDFPDEWDVT